MHLDDARPSRQIRNNLDGRLRPGFERQGLKPARLRWVTLEKCAAASADDGRRLAQRAPDKAQAIPASIQRLGRFVVNVFRHRAPSGRRKVGEVGQDQIGRARVRQQVGLSENYLPRDPKGLRVRARDGEGGPTVIQGLDPEMRQSPCHGYSDSTASSAKVNDIPLVRMGLQEDDRPLDQGLRLRTGNQHVGTDANGVAEEFADSGEISNGHPSGAPVDQLCVPAFLARVQRTVRVREKRLPANAENVSQENLGI